MTIGGRITEFTESDRWPTRTGTIWRTGPGRMMPLVADSNLASGILCIGAAALLVFTEDRLFNGVWLTIAIAALAAAYAYMACRLPVNLLAPTAATLGLSRAS